MYLVRIFINKLAELYVRQNLGLIESLEIISDYKKRTAWPGKNKISMTAEFLYQQLEGGNILSNAFARCSYIYFDDFFVSFIRLGEKTGKLKDVIDFLNKKYERKHKTKEKLLEVSIYPAFVILLSIAASVFLINFTNTGGLQELYKLVFILFIVCGLVLYTIMKIMTENKLYEAFLSVDFLIRSGVSMTEAITSAITILGKKTSLGQAFIDAKEKLEFGMSLSNSLKLGERFDEGFFYAEKTGGRTEVFGRMAEWINIQTEKRQKICIVLVEPLFIFIAGIFLLILILKFFMPYISDLQLYGGI